MAVTPADEELRELLRLAVPSMLRSYISRMADYWTLGFVGHLDTASREQYDAVVLSTIHHNTTFTAFASGLASGLGTFCAQAKGARVETMNGVHFRRCGIVMTGLLVLALVAAFLCEPTLLLVGQPPRVAHDAAVYSWLTTLSMPVSILYSMLAAVCSSQGLPEAGLYASMVSCPVQVFVALVCVAEFGYLGLGIAKIMKNVIGLGTLLIFILRRRLSSVIWSVKEPSTITHAEGVWLFLRVALPSVGIAWLEWASFELLSIMVGWTNNATVNIGSFGTLYTITAVLYMTFTSLGGAVSTRVGHLLGAGRHQDIRHSIAVATALTTTVSVFVSVVMFFFRRQVCEIFASDKAIINTASRAMIGVSLTIPSYAVMMTSFGISRGSGRQAVAVTSTGVGYWLVGFPIAYFLGPAGWLSGNPVLGVWLGNAVAVSVAGITTFISVWYFTDWASEKGVLQRNNRDVGDSEGYGPLDEN
eukprot:TRINITY_DN16318_c0_g1_i1.p1 TRINITY_DN16318_c0_g1~~TRINITY_DN16318_c0_g1_i1.p1  ORF type:complete len:474 (+),score=38.24 TRINITY_DN16318_c0_g1_i1:336-1757(+)